MEPTYSVPTLFMALRVVAVVCTVSGVAQLVGWWKLRTSKRPYLREKRRTRGIAALVLLSLGVGVFVFAPYEVRNDRIEQPSGPTRP